MARPTRRGGGVRSIGVRPGCSWAAHLLILITVAQPAAGVAAEVWTAWSAWSDCSFTCGRGVRSRYRECVGHTAKGLVRLQNPMCPGRDRQFVVCEKPACPTGSDDERESQCSEHNTDEVLNALYHWVPFYGGPNSCELTCMARGYSFYYNFGHVKDGTPCKRDSDDLCVNGHCATVGCDNHVGSNAEIDDCGVCGGQNVNCAFFRRTYNKPLPLREDFGYTEVIKVPTGSAQLKVTDASNNYLALADSSMTYIINGNWVIDWPGRYEMAGTTVYYGRSGPQNETITAHGPIKEDLHLMLIFREKNPGVTYQFWLPTNKLDQIKQSLQQPSSTHKPPSHRKGTATITTKVKGPRIPKGQFPSRRSRTGVVLPDIYKPAYNRQLDEKQQGRGGGVRVSQEKLHRNRLHNKPHSVHSGGGRATLVGHGYGDDAHYASPVNDRRNEDHQHPETGNDDAPPTDITKAQAWWDAVKRRRAKDAARDVSPQLDDVNRQSYVTPRHSGHIPPTAATTTQQPLALRKAKDKVGLHKRKSNNSFTRPASCPPCRKVKKRAKHFCSSQFAIRAKILRQEEVGSGNDTRYDVKVAVKYRDHIGLLSREYIWVANRCRCPRLHDNKDYIIMGNLTTDAVTREGRLQLTRDSFVRAYNSANDKRVRNLIKNVNCDKYG